MTAVDLVDKSDVNPADEFVVADAFEFVKDHWREFDFIHAGPPCQADCNTVNGTNGGSGGHVSLMEPTLGILRNLWNQEQIPYVVENPSGNARNRGMRYDVTLCGEMFPETQPVWNVNLIGGPGDLTKPGVLRHRHFELGGWSATAPVHPKHRGRVRGVRHGQYFDGPYVAVYGDGGYKASIEEAQRAMGIPWIADRVDLNEAIPPAYTEFLGKRLMAELTREKAA